MDPLTYSIHLGANNDPPQIADGVASRFYFPTGLTDSTVYYWKVVATDEHGATTAGPVWQFSTLELPENNIPNVPSDPYPEDGATGIAPPVTLSWYCSDPDGDELTFHLYWGITWSLENEVLDLDTSAYTLTNLTPWAHYLWKVIVEDEHGAAIEGPLWEFDAAISGNGNRFCTPTSPYPENGATGITQPVTLSWTCNDPDGDDVTFEVNWGTAPDNLQVLISGLDESSCIPPELGSNTCYYWQIVAEDEHGLRGEGPTWTFCTTGGLELAIANTVTMEFAGESEVSESYDQARSTSWNNYLSSTGEPGWFNLAGTVGQAAYLSYTGFPQYPWGIINSGHYFYGDYSLDSKDGYSSAYCKFTSMLGTPSDDYRTLLPFYIQVYIDGVFAGQMEYQSPGTFEYETFEFPLDFNSVKVGSNVRIEIRSDRFMQENPAPPFPLAEQYTEYFESAVIGGTKIILR